MTRHDPIIAADEAEEQSAAAELQSAGSIDDLTGIWWTSCEHFRGAARERLQDQFSKACRRLGVLAP